MVAHPSTVHTSLRVPDKHIDKNVDGSSPACLFISWCHTRSRLRTLTPKFQPTANPLFIPNANRLCPNPCLQPAHLRLPNPNPHNVILRFEPAYPSSSSSCRCGCGIYVYVHDGFTGAKQVEDSTRYALRELLALNRGRCSSNQHLIEADDLKCLRGQGGGGRVLWVKSTFSRAWNERGGREACNRF